MIKNYENDRMKYGIKLRVYLRKNLIMNQCIMTNTLKKKVEKGAFIIIKCLEKMNVLLVYL